MRGQRAPARGVVAATAALLLTGCGGASEPDQDRRTLADPGTSSTAATTDETSAIAGEAPVAAYTAWLDALARQDAAAACALQAPELTIELRYEAILVDRAELGDPCTGFEALLWEDPEFESEIVDVTVTQETREDALLDVRLGQGEDTTDLTVRMVYHRAKWRVFATEDRTEGGSAATGPARWVGAWCSLSPDQSREEIIDLMGEPSGEYTVSDGGEPQLWWAQDQYDFRVYLDVDGSVLELVGDYDALTEEDRAALTCPELRS